jgi:hypothetical protein
MHSALGNEEMTDAARPLLLVANSYFVNAKQIAQLALQRKLPAISVYQQFVTEGGLLAYGPDTADVFRRSAGYVDRILKGGKPCRTSGTSPDQAGADHQPQDRDARPPDVCFEG